MIGSAREVARLCKERIAFQWLCGGVGMDAKTLADFRVDHGAVLERLLVDSFTALVRAGVASLDRVAQDGVRVRASAGAASFRRHSTLQDCQRETEPRASTTDAEARVMKMADGGFRPAYNVQFATDTKSLAIAAVSVDNVGSDMGKLAPMNDALAWHYGERRRQHFVDGGFVKFADIEALTRNGVAVFVPVSKPRDESRDRHAPQFNDSPGVATWRKRMSEDVAKTIYKQRAATAECANAQARNRGLSQFLVRNVAHIKIVALWHALTHNRMCSWRLIAA
ncbi:MAG: transposase [Acidibrevibacterium sp.]|uniref:transposase n=1 Tax=Acidibrevibacterium sp. TaxID=2606776 RepID=UPI003CFDD8F2